MNEDGKGFKIFRMGEVRDGRLIDTGRMKYADIHRQEFERYKLRAGDVLFNRTNSFDLVGKTGIFALKGDYCFASYLVRLNLDRRKVLSEFLNYFMNSERFQKSVKKKASKSNNQANINATILSNELIQFPESLSEQQRIVGILDEAFEGIGTAKANAERSLQNARALFDGHLQVVFTQRGEGWVEKPLREWVQDISTGPFGSLLHKSDYEHGGIPLVNPINIEGDEIIPDDRKTVGKATAQRLARYALRENDIVIGRRGEIGRCAVVARDQAGWLCGTGCFVIRPSDKTDPHFLTHLLRSRPYRERLEGVSERATMPSIGNDDLANLVIRLPPVPRQRHTLELLNSFAAATQRLASLYERKLAALEALKKSLLHQAFTGQL
jgi:type I restriction enzyme, S subunit